MIGWDRKGKDRVVWDGIGWGEELGHPRGTQNRAAAPSGLKVPTEVVWKVLEYSAIFVRFHQYNTLINVFQSVLYK